MIDEEVSQFKISNVLKEDEALRMSDNRRRIFKQEIMSNPAEPNPIKLKEGLIDEEGILPDKVPPSPPPAPGGPPPGGDTTPVDAPGMGGPQSAPMPAGDPSVDPGAGTLNAPGADPGAVGGAPGEEMPPVDDAGGVPDLGGDPGGMGGMSGGFGGGGGGGGGMDDMGGDSLEDAPGVEDAPEPSSINPFEGADTTEDRLNIILTKAEELSQTKDPHIILKDVKGLIQNGFSKPQEAAGLIAALFDTGSPVLQQVSRLLAD